MLLRRMLGKYRLKQLGELGRAGSRGGNRKRKAGVQSEQRHCESCRAKIWKAQDDMKFLDLLEVSSCAKRSRDGNRRSVVHDRMLPEQNEFAGRRGHRTKVRGRLLATGHSLSDNTAALTL
jgi:hypothetical protein